MFWSFTEQQERSKSVADHLIIISHYIILAGTDIPLKRHMKLSEMT
jgi:hypothetical protein